LIHFLRDMSHLVRPLYRTCTARHSRQLSVDVLSRRLGYSQYGDPVEVVRLEEETIKCDLEPGQVVAKYLVCPVNPADINVLQGTYPIRPPLPATGGGEGVAEVVAAGDNSQLRPGDWVLPNRPMSGTWRSHSLSEDKDWIKIRNDIPAISAATMMINPCTALRMLLDFVSLKPGDWVIQNGANSGVGQAVIQIARTMGVNTVNIVRDREDIDQLKEKLTNMGGNIILTEEELRGTKMWKSGDLERPVLGFNCVGGPSSTELCKALTERGVHVTYGGMSRKPVMAATSHMIFKDLQLRGFWMGQWSERQGRSKARMEMYSHITDLVHKGQLDPPDHKFVSLDNYKEALENTLKGFLPAKYVFKID